MWRARLGILLVVGLLASQNASALAARAAYVLTEWRIPSPQSADPSVQAVEAGVVALNFLGPQLDALARHPGAKITLALDPVFVAALQRASTGGSALADMAKGQVGSNDVRAIQLLDVLSTDVVPQSSVAGSPVGKRFISDATAARLALMGDRAAHFSQRDDIDFAAAAIALSLAADGHGGAATTALLSKNQLNNHDLQQLAQTFTQAVQTLLGRLKTTATAGTVELAALPAYEPIMPLLINAAGRTQHAQFTVNVDAAADVAAAVDDGLKEAHALAPTQAAPGIFAPRGAYDDEAAVLLQAHHAAYGVFSERVAKANAGASAEAVSDVHSAAFHPYLLETSKTSKLPLFFCSDAISTALDSQPPSSPPTAIADRLEAAVNGALAATQGAPATVVMICLDGTGTALRRPDRAAVLNDLMAKLGADRTLRATTPKAYLREHPPTMDTYGYKPGTDAGGFDLWMGSANQMSMWSALADARKAVGGDAALSKPGLRDLLLRAESGAWYLSLALSQPRAITDQTLAKFRALIADIYRTGDKPVPSDIAPVKVDASAPVGVESK